MKVKNSISDKDFLEIFTLDNNSNNNKLFNNLIKLYLNKTI